MKPLCSCNKRELTSLQKKSAALAGRVPTIMQETSQPLAGERLYPHVFVAEINVFPGL